LVEIVGTGEVTTGSESDSEFDVVEGGENVGDHHLLIDRDAQDLSLSVDTDDTASRLVFASDEHGFARDSVHVETSSRFEVVKVDETVLGDEVDDAVTSRDLHGDGEIVGGFGREEDVDCFLGIDGC